MADFKNSTPKFYLVNTAGFFYAIICAGVVL